MSTFRLLSIPALPAFGFLALLAGWAELEAEVDAGQVLAEALARAGEEQLLAPALTPKVRRAQMDLCLRLAEDPVALVFPAAPVATLSAACQRRAQDILADTPTSGAALAVLGLTTGAEGLASARRAAPYEGWLAGHRFAAATRGAEPALYAGIGEDAALLIALGRAEEVALAYVASPALRAALTVDLAQMPLAEKRRFLRAAEAAAEGAADGL